jgi:hypothetical protein
MVPDARSRNDQLAIAPGRCGRQRFDVMIEFYDRAQRAVPVLFLAAANRQDMIERRPTSCCQNRNIGSRLFVESPTSMTFFASASATPLTERHIASVSETSRDPPVTAIAAG